MIRIIIADDSPFIRARLEELFTAQGIAVVAALENGAEAVEAVRRLKPDAVVMDYEMPVMDGIEALEMIRRDSAVPVIIFSAYTPEGAVQTLRAVEAGAHDVILKPAGGQRPPAVIEQELVASVRCAAGAKTAKRKPFEIAARQVDVICAGSSAGGVYAAGRILPLLPTDMPPVVWVQHMPAEFMAAFAGRLNSISRLEVKLAEQNEPLRHGVCYMSPHGTECGLRKTPNGYAIALSACNPRRRFCPSCDGIFESAAEVCGARAVGVILSGIGSDGTDGLVRLHNAGGYVVGQSESSCVVYGMPHSAAEAGAVDITVPLEDITPLLCKLTGAGAK
ncbi:MAG: chemotaxis-specific protein-glutamate methyltransferase CheB [Elusimicrobiaceae bacterium]|nr:chemotaxis-specific protein-glutamate methyltransferase CheB [Elusimicrobiaceae bacterium]